MWQKRHGIMLCQPVDERNLERNFKESPTLLAQPKLDGQRAWVDWVDGRPLLISSTGEVVEGVPHINLALSEFAKVVGPMALFDGELYVHKRISFEEIISRTKRLSNNLHPHYWEVEYHIFDHKSPEPNAVRAVNLKQWLVKWNQNCEPEMSGLLNFVETFSIKRNQVEATLNAFIALGYEGIILRNPLSPYVEKRPYTILKWKPSKQDCYKILQPIEAISEQGQPLGELGALLCIDRYGNTFKVGCGVGIDQGHKKTLWEMRESLPQMWALVTYQNLTKNGIPRFGKFTHVSIEPINSENWE